MDELDLLTSVVIGCPEEVDIVNAESMRQQLRRGFGPGVAVVIAGMTATMFCDMACFRNLLIAQDEAVANGAELRLVIGPGPVLRILKVAGFDGGFSVYPTVALARAG